MPVVLKSSGLGLEISTRDCEISIYDLEITLLDLNQTQIAPFHGMMPME